MKKWYFRNSSLVVAFLAVGPFCLPLVWFNPSLTRKAKILISAAIIILTLALGVMFADALKSITRYYQAVF